MEAQQTGKYHELKFNFLPTASAFPFTISGEKIYKNSSNTYSTFLSFSVSLLYIYWTPYFYTLYTVRTQIIQPPVDTTVLLGLNATLQCKVSSDPTVPYNVDWYREGHPTAISNSQRIGVQSDGTLEIQAVRASDVGTYQCVVTSPGGNETRSARLSVIELPFPPSNVKVARLDAPNQRTINVSWTPGFDGNSPILKFIVQRREVSELGKCANMLAKYILLYYIYKTKNVNIRSIED